MFRLVSSPGRVAASTSITVAPALPSRNGTWVGAPGRTVNCSHDLAVLPQGDRHVRPRIGGIVDPQLQRLRLADNAEAWRLQNDELTVALVRVTGEQHVQRCAGSELGGISRRVVGLAVGKRDHGPQPRAIALGQRLLRRENRRRALAAFAVDGDLAQLDAGQAAEPLPQRALGRVDLGGRSPKRWLGERSVSIRTRSSSGSRCSRRRIGLARNGSTRARNTARHAVPRARRQKREADQEQGA